MTIITSIVLFGIIGYAVYGWIGKNANIGPAIGSLFKAIWSIRPDKKSPKPDEISGGEVLIPVKDKDGVEKMLPASQIPGVVTVAQPQASETKVKTDTVSDAKNKATDPMPVRYASTATLWWNIALGIGLPFLAWIITDVLHPSWTEFAVITVPAAAEHLIGEYNYVLLILGAAGLSGLIMRSIWLDSMRKDPKKFSRFSKIMILYIIVIVGNWGYQNFDGSEKLSKAGDRTIETIAESGVLSGGLLPRMWKYTTDPEDRAGNAQKFKVWHQQLSAERSAPIMFKARMSDDDSNTLCNLEAVFEKLGERSYTQFYWNGLRVINCRYSWVQGQRGMHETGCGVVNTNARKFRAGCSLTVPKTWYTRSVEVEGDVHIITPQHEWSPSAPWMEWCFDQNVDSTDTASTLSCSAETLKAWKQGTTRHK